MTAGLDQHRLATLEECRHQWIHTLLQERLAAGNLDQIATKPIDLRQHVVDRSLAALVERVGSVTPRTAEVARGETHEDTPLPRIGGLALDGMEDFVDRDQTLY